MSFGRALSRRRPGARRLRRSRASARLRIGIPRARLRLVLATVLGVGILLAAGWMWLRDSSLVAVERVTVSGQSGPDSAAIRSALISAARSMTTLDVQLGQLHTAVSPFPVVKDLQVSTQFPHGMRIRVIEQLPVAAITVGGRRVAVAADGTLLHDLAVSPGLPLIPLAVPPGGPRLTEAPAASAVAVLAAAPYQLLPKISQVTTVSGHGLVAQVRGGPSIYFGDATGLRAKWISASEVLADPGSVGAAYIDVTDPVRPAAGAGAGSPSTGSAGSTSAGGASASGTPGG
jgi:cell division protein FtsQ